MTAHSEDQMNGYTFDNVREIDREGENVPVKR